MSEYPPVLTPEETGEKKTGAGDESDEDRSGTLAARPCDPSALGRPERPERSKEYPDDEFQCVLGHAAKRTMNRNPHRRNGDYRH